MYIASPLCLGDIAIWKAEITQCRFHKGIYTNKNVVKQILSLLGYENI